MRGYMKKGHVPPTFFLIINNIYTLGGTGYMNIVKHMLKKHFYFFHYTL